MRRLFFILIIISLLLSVRSVFAYDDKTTHPALTDEAVDFYNAEISGSPPSISQEEKEWIVEGSILEDTEPRYINHFYDPVYKQGWTGEKGYDWISAELIQKFSDVFFSPESSVTAVNWVHNQELQEKYKRYLGNSTWEKAIYEYVKNKNKKEAFLALGHILHLLEDMTVPEHTRNDTHPNDSPYENYAKQFTRDNLRLADDFQKQNLRPADFDTLDEYFEYLANYSNNYFFSKDTINIEKYAKPKIAEEKNIFGYGFDKHGGEFPLVGIETRRVRDGDEYKNTKVYLLAEDNLYEFILSAYWSRLSREAVLGAAGVINLFFEEAEKAEKDESLLKAPPKNEAAIVSIWGEINKTFRGIKTVRDSVTHKIAGWFGLDSTTVNTVIRDGNQASVASAITVPESVNSNTNTANSDIAGVNANEIEINNSNFSETSQPQTLVTSDITNIEQPQKSVPPDSFVTSDVVNKSLEVGLPKFPMGIPASAVGGGGSAAPVVSTVSAVSQNQNAVQQDSSTSESSAENSTSATDSTDIATTTEIATTTVQASSTPVMNTDTTPPSVSFSIAECGESLSPDGCLVSTTTLRLSWQSADDDLDYFELTQDGAVSTTTATSTLAAVSDNSLSNFSLRAKDTAGNWSDSVTISVEISKMPVVINEVAWAGTGQSNSQDEWIELYNRSGKTINLSDWILYSQTDMGPYLRLSGAIPAKGYYLIERTNDDTIKDIPADFIAPFGNGLSNSGEVLVLSHASTTIDQTVLCGYGPVAWCPGFDYKYRAMERISADSSGTDASNWGYNNTVVQNGTNENGTNVNGTPKNSNSVSHLIANGMPYISTDVILTKDKSPYLVNNTVQVFNSGATLTIMPGVVIKFYNDAGLNISGKIIARGTAEEPIVFTSFEDDEYGGDFNNNGTTTAPSPGGWFGVKLSSSASGDSVFEHSIFRYGGKYYYGGMYSKSLLATEGPSVSVSDSVFEYSKVYGLLLAASNSKVTNNIFRHNSTSVESVGLYIGGGEPVVENNQFLSNQRGLYISNSSSTISSNVFSNNSGEAVYSNGAIGTFENNSGTGNGLNGIFISGGLANVGESREFRPNDLPYILSNNVSVAAGSTLAVRKGVVVKGQVDIGLSVSGKLVVDGETPSDIMFTSAYASPSPGDWAGIDVLVGGSLEGRGFTISYAGSRAPSGPAVRANKASVNLDNVIFDNNRNQGMVLSNSDSKLENVIFENHTTPGGATALYYNNSPIYLKNANFSNNWLAVYADSASILQTAENIIFENNTSTTSPANLF